MTVYAGRHPEHVRSIMLQARDIDRLQPMGAGQAGRGAARGSGWSARARAPVAALRSSPTSARLATRLRLHPMSFTPRAGDRQLHLGVGRERPRHRRLRERRSARRWPGSRPWCAARWRATSPRCSAASRPGSSAPRACSPTPAPAAAPGESAFLASACHDFPRAFSYADSEPTRRAAYERCPRGARPGRAARPFSAPHGCTEGSSSPDWCLNWPADSTAGSPLAPGTRASGRAVPRALRRIWTPTCRRPGPLRSGPVPTVRRSSRSPTPDTRRPTPAHAQRPSPRTSSARSAPTSTPALAPERRRPSSAQRPVRVADLAPSGRRRCACAAPERWRSSPLRSRTSLEQAVHLAAVGVRQRTARWALRRQGRRRRANHRCPRRARDASVSGALSLDADRRRRRAPHLGRRRPRRPGPGPGHLLSVAAAARSAGSAVDRST